MCGRYALAKDKRTLSLELDADWSEHAEWRPSYNIAPTQHSPVLLAREGRRILDMYRWGLIPFWAKDPGAGSKMINARAETVAEKPAYRSAFKAHRCLVPASGFYEWQVSEGGKIPQWIYPLDGGLLTLAGLTARWEPGGGAEPVYSYTILTTAANQFIQPVHERMPVIVAPEDRDAWLDADTPIAELQALLRAAPEEALQRHGVSKQVNSPQNNAPVLIEVAL